MRLPAHKDLARLDKRIAMILDAPPAFLADLCGCTMRSGGKRLRGRLALTLGDLLGAPGAKLLTAAAAVETVHLAALIHDDIIDGAEKRRSGPSLHRSRGLVPAVLYGDVLIARAAAAIHSLGKRKLMGLLLSTVHSLCSGEILEAEMARSFPWEAQDYFRAIDLKTASLFRYCCQAPGILSGASRRKLVVLDRFGFNLGIFYQICDDCMDFAPPSSSDGKDRLMDIKNGLPNLPVLLASRDKKLKAALEKAMRSRSAAAHRRRVAARVREGGFVGEAARIASGYLERARVDLSAIRKWCAGRSPRLLERYMEELDRILARAAGD